MESIRSGTANITATFTSFGGTLALLPDREVTLSYTVTAEPGRQVAARVPELLRESTGSGWVNRW